MTSYAARIREWLACTTLMMATHKPELYFEVTELVNPCSDEPCKEFEKTALFSLISWLRIVRA